MITKFQHWGVKSSCSKVFNLIDKFAKIIFQGTRLLRQYINALWHYDTKALSRLFNFLMPQNLSNLVSFDKITQKTLAFTLAETLVVMGIIGIVSALTLPNLNSSTGDKEKVAKVKKIYQNLNDAYGRAVAVYGPVDEWPKSGGSSLNEKNFVERITEFLKISRIIDGKYDETRYVLADGTEIWFDLKTIDPSEYVPEATFVGIIRVDIDGPNKGKSQEGTDLFEFDVTTKGIYPNGCKDDELADKCFSNGYCARWVVEVGNMDYLKADSNGKCENNNSITLSWTTTTCK